MGLQVGHPSHSLMTHFICGFHQSVLPWLQVLCKADQVKTGEEEREGDRERKNDCWNRPVCADVEVTSVRIVHLRSLQ